MLPVSASSVLYSDESQGIYKMILDFTPFKKALSSLSEEIVSTSDDAFMASLNEAQRRTMRAGVIQNFEFTYELSWKMLRRQLKAEDGANEINVLSRKDLFRLAAQKTLLDDPEPWFVFHHARNQTSHTYDEETAKEVYAITIDFLPMAEQLLARLEARKS